MGAWVYIRRCLTFRVKIKLRNIRGYPRFFLDCTVFAACTLQRLRLPSFHGPLPSKNPRCLPVVQFFLILKACSHSVCVHCMRDVFSNKWIGKSYDAILDCFWHDFQN